MPSVKPIPSNPTDAPPSGQANAEAAKAREPRQTDEWRPAGENFKSIPETKEERERIRACAREAARRFSPTRAPRKKEVREAAEELLKPLGYDDSYIGFTMVLIHNEYWRDEFAAIPFEKRVLSLPRCLRHGQDCIAEMERAELHCQDCGQCVLPEFEKAARRLGYKVAIVEGSPVTLKMIAFGQVRAALGVACLNVLERSFDKAMKVGLPALAIPLLRDTCVDTEVDADWVMEAIGYQRRKGVKRAKSYLPLLQRVVRDFEDPELEVVFPRDRSDAPDIRRWRSRHKWCSDSGDLWQ